MSIFRIFSALLLALGITSISSNAKASCGEVTIAEMNWASAQMIAYIDATILGTGYDCDVELIPAEITFFGRSKVLLVKDKKVRPLISLR